MIEKSKLKKVLKILLILFFADLLITWFLFVIFLNLPKSNHLIFWVTVIFGIIAVLLWFAIQFFGEILLFNSISNYLRRRKGSEKQLNDEYFNEYKTIKYLISASFTGTRRKDILNDVLDLFLSAQEKGRNSKEVVGNSEEFAIKIIESYGIVSNGWLNFLLGVFVSTLNILTFHLVHWVLGKKAFFHSSSPPLIPIFTILFGIVMLPILYNFKNENRLNKRKIFAFIFSFGSIFLVLFSCFIVYKFYHFNLLHYLITPSIPMIPNIFVLVLYFPFILSFFLCNHLYRKKAFQQLIKKQSGGEI